MRLRDGLLSYYVVLAVSSGQPVPIEKQLHLLETFETDWCTSPHVSSPAPYFTFNGITLNTDELNRQFGATVIRSNGLEGHHQAKLVIASVKKTTVNDSIIVACLVNSAVLLEYHLIIGEYNFHSLPLILLCTHADVL